MDPIKEEQDSQNSCVRRNSQILNDILINKKRSCTENRNKIKKNNVAQDNLLNQISEVLESVGFDGQKRKISSSDDINGGNKSFIKVFVRFRPMNEVEKTMLNNQIGWIVPKFIDDKSFSINSSMTTSSSKQLLSKNEEEREQVPKELYKYDRIYDENSTQESIYSDVGKPLVNDILSGYNGTVFAYGQSGSGKTFTMYGEDIENDELKGIIPRMIEDIFQKVDDADDDVEFQFKLSVIEIYKEILYDLISQKSNLKMNEHPINGLVIDGLTEVYLSNVSEFFEYVYLALSNRRVAETKLNRNSSRSHCILILEVTQKFNKENIIKKGILNLVDLAGSEKVSKTGAVGETLEEAKKINLSLSTLGNVINALTKHSDHIPYRDSKLTRILKGSIGGNSKTSLIVTCSPHSYNLQEIESSLYFADRVKTIKNTVKVNIKYSYNELQQMVNTLNERLMKMNKKLQMYKNGEIVKESDEENSDNSKQSNGEKENIELIKKQNKLLEEEVKKLKEKLEEKEKNQIDNNKEFLRLSDSKQDTSLLERIKKLENEFKILNFSVKENEKVKYLNNSVTTLKRSLTKEINSKPSSLVQKLNNILKTADIPSKINENGENYILKEAEIYKKNLDNCIKNDVKGNKKFQNYLNEYLHYYFSNKILNNGYNKLLNDNNALCTMIQISFEIMNKLLKKIIEIKEENNSNVEKINLLQSSFTGSSLIRNQNKKKTFVKKVSKMEVGIKKDIEQNLLSYNDSDKNSFINNNNDNNKNSNSIKKSNLFGNEPKLIVENDQSSETSDINSADNKDNNNNNNIINSNNNKEKKENLHNFVKFDTMKNEPLFNTSKNEPLFKREFNRKCTYDHGLNFNFGKIKLNLGYGAATTDKNIDELSTLSNVLIRNIRENELYKKDIVSLRQHLDTIIGENNKFLGEINGNGLNNKNKVIVDNSEKDKNIKANGKVEPLKTKNVNNNNNNNNNTKNANGLNNYKSLTKTNTKAKLSNKETLNKIKSQRVIEKNKKTNKNNVINVREEKDREKEKEKEDNWKKRKNYSNSNSIFKTNFSIVNTSNDEYNTHKTVDSSPFHTLSASTSPRMFTCSLSKSKTIVSIEGKKRCNGSVFSINKYSNYSNYLKNIDNSDYKSNLNSFNSAFNNKSYNTSSINKSINSKHYVSIPNLNDINIVDICLDNQAKKALKDSIEKGNGTATRKMGGVKISVKNGNINFEVEGGLSADNKTGKIPLDKPLSQLKGDE